MVCRSFPNDWFLLVNNWLTIGHWVPTKSKKAQRFSNAFELEAAIIFHCPPYQLNVQFALKTFKSMKQFCSSPAVILGFADNAPRK